MAKKTKKTKRTKKVKAEPKTELVLKVVLLGLKFNRSVELEELLNDGFKFLYQITSRAGEYVVLGKEVPVINGDINTNVV